MNTTEWLDKVAYKTMIQIGPKSEPPTNVYESIFDGSYITHVGMEDDVKHLAEREITEELTHGVGYSPLDKKWYGWSHRTIYGFKVGSTCTKADCHYVASSDEEAEQAAIDFLANEYHLNSRCDGIIVEQDGKRYYDIKWDYSDTVPNKKLRNTIGGTLYPIDRINPLGRGEWVAETMDDAKQMAIDFSEGVS